MKRRGRLLFVSMATLAAAWLLGRALLDVQLPGRQDGDGAFPEPMAPDLPLRAAFEALPSAGAETAPLRLLDDNAAAWTERWRLLDAAAAQLDVSYFILKEDVFGAAFLGHLIQRARAGVRVRLLLDAMGTRMSRNVRGNGYLDTLVATPNVVARRYRPLPFRYLDAFLTLNPGAVFASDHDKILLADGGRGLLGGRNISHEYFAPPDDAATAFHDTDLLVTGAYAGRRLAEAFEAQYLGGEARPLTRDRLDLWDSAEELRLAYAAMDAWLKGEPPSSAVVTAIADRGLPWLKELEALPGLRGALAAPRPPPLHAEVRLLDSRTRLVAADDPITRSLIRLVRSAKRELFIQSPYLVLPEAAVAVLADAAERGVRITVLTNGPASSDNAWSQAFFLEQWPRLLERVPTLALYAARDRHNLHGKFAAIDGRLALVGTYNLDPLSMTMNSELVLAAWSPAVVERLLDKPRARIAAGGPDTVRYRIARDAAGRLAAVAGPAPHGDAADGPVPRYRQLIRLVRRLHWDWPLL